MASRFWVGGTGTWDGSTTTHWSASSGGAGGASVPASGDSVVFDASSGGGTVTVNTNFVTTFNQSLTMGAFTGTLDYSVNNNNVTVGAFNLTGTGVRSLKMGSGTFTTISTGGTMWDAGTKTNLTFDAGTSTITLAGATWGSKGVFNSDTLTYNNLVVAPTGFSGKGLSIEGNTCTFTSVTISNLGRLAALFGIGFTTTGAFNWNGTSSAPGMIANYTDNEITFTVGAASTWTWVAINRTTKAGAGSITATNSFDCGTNTGITITPPSAGGTSNQIIGG